MSHFSSIKTNISDSAILTKSLKDLGFKCIPDYFNSSIANDILPFESADISVYRDTFENNSEELLFYFRWDGLQYMLTADIQLWSLDTNIQYFLEKLNQQYAYNMVLDQGIAHGFQRAEQKVMEDGSVKVIMQRWSSD